jgi:hypothetical protein|tara:strand:+ start:2345 stop:3910 length:1566 start_codon:yes stop_codon:yes gene_type:complete
MNPTSAESQYISLEGGRRTFLDRAREASKLTLPYLMPEEGHNSHSRLNTPFQGIGARGVNNLASKLLLALLAPNAPFFRLNFDENILRQEGATEEMLSEMESALQQVEESVMEEVSRQSYRVGVHEALKHLVVTGNSLLYLPEEGGLRVFHLDRFVVQRDPMGNPVKIITKETLAYATLSDELKAAAGYTESDSPDKDCELFTSVCLYGDEWVVHQEIKGTIVPGSEGTFKKDRMPYIPLRFSKIDGEDYGRGYVEEYMGDLISLEKLTQAIVEGSAAAAKVLFLVNPNGTTRAKTLAESPNGAITQGNAADVSVLQLDKFNDFRIASDTISAIKDRLGHAFLLTSGVVRNAERVTAEEIRMLTMELESSLGGLYSLLSNELQLPMVLRVMDVMGRKKQLPKLPKDLVKPVIITGIEALGRGNDLQKLDLFLAGAAQVVGPEAIGQHVNVEEYFKRRATSLGIKTQGLIKTQEQIQQEMQQAQMMAMAEKAAPQGAAAIGNLARDAMAPTPEEEGAPVAEE